MRFLVRGGRDLMMMDGMGWDGEERGGEVWVDGMDGWNGEERGWIDG